MVRHSIFLLLIILTTISCETGVSKTAITGNNIDSALTTHLDFIDSIESTDTTDIHYKVLKAYLRRDSSFFATLKENTEHARRNLAQKQQEDTCIIQRKLQNLNVDEAYRFVYLGPFCPYKINLTITKNGNLKNLHFILYRFNWDTSACRIINEFDKPLNDEDWDLVKSRIDRADFWGLKSENGKHGVDGSTLEVRGYIKADQRYNRPTKYHYIYRWSGSTLDEVFRLLLQISKGKSICLV